MLPKFEYTDIYPGVAQALEDLSLAYWFQVQMPLYGRADFVIHNNGESTAILECKANCVLVKQDIVQVWSYCIQFRPIPRPFLIIPAHRVLMDDKALCQQYEVEILALPLGGNWRTVLSRLKRIARPAFRPDK